jgi:hypothetical protein
MEFWIVLEENLGEIFLHPFNCLQMARDYARENCSGYVRIELHVMNLGWQGNESLESE